MVDLGDKDNLVQYKCETCKISPTTHAISIQKSREQESIEKSVKLDLDNRKVSVTYLWSKNPVEFLSKKHGTNNNYRQAKNVYDSQCKKAEINTNNVNMILGLHSQKISVKIKLDTISRINNPIISVYIMLIICLFRKPLSPEMREAMKEDLIVFSSADTSTEAANRIYTARCSGPKLGADILIKDPRSNTWGSDQPFDKHHIVQRLVGYRPTMGKQNGNDEIWKNS